MDAFDAARDENIEYEMRHRLLAQAHRLVDESDTDLLPRFHDYLQSQDVRRVELGLYLVERVGDRGSVPFIKHALRAPNSTVQGAALRVLGSYDDMALLPVIRAAMDDTTLETDAVRALRPMARRPEVRALILELLRSPKHVLVARELASAAGIELGKVELAVAELTYVWPSEGFSIAHPETWTDSARTDYAIAFENAALSSWYGVKVSAHEPSRSAGSLLDDFARAERLAPTGGQAHPPINREQLAVIGAEDGAGRTYHLEDPQPSIASLVVLVQGGRAYAVVGRAPRAHADVFAQVFQTAWNSMRLSAPRDLRLRHVGSRQVTLDIE